MLLLECRDLVAAVSRWCDSMEAQFPRLNARPGARIRRTARVGELLNDSAPRAIWRHVLELAPTLGWIERRETVVLERVATGVAFIICVHNGR